MHYSRKCSSKKREGRAQPGPLCVVVGGAGVLTRFVDRGDFSDFNRKQYKRKYNEIKLSVGWWESVETIMSVRVKNRKTDESGVVKSESINRARSPGNVISARETNK